MQFIVTYTNSWQIESISQDFSFIWAQTLRQGIYLVPEQIIAITEIFYFHPTKHWRLHLVYVEIYVFDLIS